MLDARLHGMCSGHPSCIEMVHLCSGQLCLTAPASANNQIAAMTVPSLTTCYLCVAPQSGPTYQERQESGPVGGSRRQSLAHRNKRPRLFEIWAQLSPTPHFGDSICDFWAIQQHEAFCQASDVQRRFSDAQRRPAQRRPATFQRRSATPQRRPATFQRRPATLSKKHKIASFRGVCSGEPVSCRKWDLAVQQCSNWVFESQNTDLEPFSGLNSLIASFSSNEHRPLSASHQTQS